MAPVTAGPARAVSEPLSVCVFCASSEKVAPHLRSLAATLGSQIASRGWRLVYGGGGVGLMGEVARAALAGGAHVTGVMPHRLADLEQELLQVSELVRTDTMRQRKGEMDARADAFVVLPGGIGTLEELLEALTLRQLGYHDRPIVLLDPDGFWAPLRAQVDQFVALGLAQPDVARDLVPMRGPDEALNAVAAAVRARAPS